MSKRGKLLKEFKTNISLVLQSLTKSLELNDEDAKWLYTKLQKHGDTLQSIAEKDQDFRQKLANLDRLLDKLPTPKHDHPYCHNDDDDLPF